MSARKSHKRNSGRLLAFFLCLGLLCGLLPAVGASASTQVQAVPYQSYTLDAYGEPVVNKASYVPSALYQAHDWGISTLSEPQDICYDSRTKGIYILDSGNSRVVVLNEDYTLNRVYENIQLDGETVDFYQARGISVNHKGQIFISDTEHGRVLVLDQTGTVDKVLLAPKDDLVPADFNFKPIDTIEDQKGFTYVLSEGSYYGALVYSEDGSFFQFYGANKVNMDALALIGQIIDKLFTSDELRAKGVQNLPYQFTDLCLGPDDFLYSLTSVSQSGLGQVRKLSPAGDNILSFRSGYQSANADEFDFSDGQEYIDPQRNLRKTAFGDITVDADEYIYLLDITYGRIFVYDRACNLITVFGGGVGIGTQVGTFQQPVALAVVNGDVLVLDAAKGNVTVFEPTDHFNLIRQADALNLKGDYLQAKPLWEQVNSQDKNFLLAYSGIANGYLTEGNYEQAMYYAKAGGNTTIYAEAYQQIRNDFLTANFGWIALALVVIVCALLALILYTSKRQVVLIRHERLRVMTHTLTHPLNAFNDVKHKQLGSGWLALGLLVIYCIMSILRVLGGGFMFVDYDAQTYNALYPVFGSLGMVVLWTVINWAVCTLLEGKGKLKEIFIVTCYSLIPQILYILLFLGLSRFLIPSEAGFLSVLSTICMIWTVLLLLFGMMTVHDFSFTKAIGTSILSVLGIVLLAFIILMLATLFQDFITFVQTLFNELFFRYNA